MEASSPSPYLSFGLAPASHPTTLGCQKQQRRDENSDSISDLGKVSFLHNSAPILWMAGKQQNPAPEAGQSTAPKGLQCEWLASLLSVPCLSLTSSL